MLKLTVRGDKEIDGQLWYRILLFLGIREDHVNITLKTLLEMACGFAFIHIDVGYEN